MVGGSGFEALASSDTFTGQANVEGLDDQEIDPRSVRAVCMQQRARGLGSRSAALTCCTAGSAAIVVSCGWKEIGASTDSRLSNVPVRK